MTPGRPTHVPALPPPPRVQSPVPARMSLPNGLRILCVSRNRLPVADVLLTLPYGSGAGSPATAGLAHLTAELLDTGTSTRSEFDIAAGLDRLGARMDAAAGWDHTTIALHCLSGSLADSLDLLADIALRPAFPEAEFMRGREQRRAEILQELDDPDILADLAIARAIYGRHHVYGVAAAGTRATIASLERIDLVRQHATSFAPDRAFVIVAGDVEPSHAFDLIADRLGRWNPGPSEPGVIPPRGQPGNFAIHLIDRPGAPQSEIRIGCVGVPRSSPDYFPIVAMNTVLGGSFTSRLNVRLREEGGYTYGAFSGFGFRLGAGPFVAGAAVFTEVTARAVAESLEEMRRIREEAVPADELMRAKTYVMLGLPRAFETSAGIASRIAETELHGLGDGYWREFPDRVEAVTADAVMTAAGSALRMEELQIVIVGDAARIRAPLEALDIGPVMDMMPPDEESGAKERTD